MKHSNVLRDNKTAKCPEQKRNHSTGCVFIPRFDTFHFSSNVFRCFFFAKKVFYSTFQITISVAYFSSEGFKYQSTNTNKPKIIALKMVHLCNDSSTDSTFCHF